MSMATIPFYNYLILAALLAGALFSLYLGLKKVPGADLARQALVHEGGEPKRSSIAKPFSSAG
jgi:hypothetical protein